MQKIKILTYNITADVSERLAAFEDIEISAKTIQLEQCIQFAEMLSPDIILADDSLTSEEASILKEKLPEMKLVTFSAAENADAYCGNDLSDEEIHTILRMSAENTADFDINSVNKMIAKMQSTNNRRAQLLDLYRGLFHLSKGELGLLRALCHGETYESIACGKFVAPDSVRRMANRLVKHLGEENLESLLKRLNSLGAFDVSDNTENH